MRGFTLIEFLLTLAMIVILVGATLPLYTNLQVSAQLNENTDQLTQTLRLARVRAIERLNNEQHGIYFNIDQNGQDSYTLFQGSSYASRNAAYDRTVTLDSTLALTSSLSDGSDEMVFTRTRGKPSTTGTLTFTHATYGSRTLSINAAGTVDHN